jgi:hypothetical protein
VACGRFGPLADRLWRHEFAVPEWDDSMDALAMFWDHLTPIITKNIQLSDGGLPVKVTFPSDCIQVLRCRPFRFSHRVVNAWFANRTVLIGMRRTSSHHSVDRVWRVVFRMPLGWPGG